MARNAALLPAFAFPILFALSGVALSAAEPEKADAGAEAAEAFDKVFGNDLKRVKATRDPSDDIDLAKRMLAAAQDAEAQPEFLAALCQNACDLAGAHAEGVKTAMDALSLLSAHLPEKAGFCAEKAVEVRQKQFDVAKGEAKAKAGEDLIDALLAAVNVKSAAGDYREALVLAKRGQAVARAIKSDLREKIDARCQALAKSMTSVREAQDLQKQIEKDPQNAAAREKLVRLWLVELDCPAEAAKYVEGVGDADLAKYVPAAAKPLDAAPELACVELGDWYYTLAGGASAGARPLMLERAQAYYERFLDTHKGKDMDSQRAAAAVKNVEGELDKLGESANRKTQPWVELLGLVDVPKDTAGGSWERQGSSISLTKPGWYARINVPVSVNGSYELGITFSRTSGQDAFILYFPAGKSMTSIHLARGSQHLLENVDGKLLTLAKPVTLENNRDYVFRIKVVLERDQAEITTSLDGDRFGKWRGDQAALSLWQGKAAMRKDAPMIGCDGSTVIIRSCRIRMLSGECKPLRTPEKAAPTKPRK